MTNCETCTSASTCTKCVDGLYLSYLGNSCVVNCDDDEIIDNIKCDKCNKFVTDCIKCPAKKLCSQCTSLPKSLSLL